MPSRYDPAEIEPKWRKRWAEADLFRTREDPDRPKFYGLDFFPYPSGAGLSVGHLRNYIPTDVLCRMKYMQGCNVLHPMGWDAFGLPAENEAIAQKVRPAPMVREYAANYKRQMNLVGLAFDWSREVNSSTPDFYHWTQWIFSVLFKRGLAYHAEYPANWCPNCRSVLANEEVPGGLCWRCDTPVEKKMLKQWFFKITEYAQRLLDDLDDLDWPEGIKSMQRNWIGRSEGVEFEWRLRYSGLAEYFREILDRKDSDEATGLSTFVRNVIESYAIGDSAAQVGARLGQTQQSVRNAINRARQILLPSAIRVFTTRIDTVFGSTFCVLSPEHPLTLRVTAPDRREEVAAYVRASARLSEQDRLAAGREKEGVFTGAYAEHPFSGEQVPVWVADYVLMGYGTGAIMAVPGHDERDFEFAKKYGLEIPRVIAPSPGGRGQGEGETGVGTPPPPQPSPAEGGRSLPFSAEDGVL
ncbi:MAG: class I tRNA ligase family protein, partial [Armatimonadetes bacterium]|nr:class I tRNA ligase family protein [Armatimonadota bacterium]